MALVSTNEYSPNLVATKLIALRGIAVGNSRVSLVTAIEQGIAGGVVTLRMSYKFGPERAALIFQGVDPTKFQPDPRRQIERCSFCGLDLQDSFDTIDVAVSVRSINEMHYLRAHAACLNDSLGRGSRIDFFVGTGHELSQNTDVEERGSGSVEGFRRVLDRIMEVEQLNFKGASIVEIAAIEVASNGAVVQIDADYVVLDHELRELLSEGSPRK